MVIFHSGGILTDEDFVFINCITQNPLRTFFLLLITEDQVLECELYICKYSMKQLLRKDVGAGN